MSDKPDLFTAPLPACCESPAHSINHMAKAATCLRCKATFAWDERKWTRLAPQPAPISVAE
jgi:hypothetical protein